MKTNKKLKLKKWAIVILIAIVSIAAWGTAAIGDTESVEPEQPQVVAADSEKTIRSITFKKDMGIKDALRFLAANYEKNIIPSTDVEGMITITSLYDVTFKQALDSILGHNYKYDQDGNFIRIYTAEEYTAIKADKSRMTHKVFTLYYISATEALKLINSAISDAGSMTGSTPAEDGISVGGGISDASGGNSMALNDTIIMHDYPENIAIAEELLKSIDVRPQQVLVEATILSATLTEGMALGVDFNFMGGTNLTGSTGTDDLVSGDTVSRGSSATEPIAQIAQGVVGSAIETFGFASKGADGLRIGVRSGDIAAFITALESVTDTTVLANPKILALNKQVGTVFIGQKLGYRDSTSVSASGVATEGEVNFLDSGTKLSFRPHIGRDGYIRMDIYPKDSSAELNEDKVPTETTAELTTNIMVKDGQTIVIGGLFRDVVTTSRSQVPLLGDLPLIGALFRNTSDSSVRQEIIVMLTPHIVTESVDTKAKARLEDISRKRFGAKEALQWAGRARLAEEHYANAAQSYANGDSMTATIEVEKAIKLRPTYLEARRLKDKITRETKPHELDKSELFSIDKVEEDVTQSWKRY